MINYFYSYNDGDLKYTIDMLRISMRVFYTDYKRIFDYCMSYYLSSSDENKKYYQSQSQKIGLYADNFVVNNVWVGLGCNNPKTKEKNKILITFEFNPNKVKENNLFLKILRNCKDVAFLKRFDLAIDIPENINNLEFENLRKRASTIYYQYQSNKTIYFGKRNGHTKIYNKKIESNLDYELTRYEVTTEVSEIYFSNFDVSNISISFLNAIKKPYNENTGNKTYNAIAYALNNGFHFKDLSRDMQKNIRENQKTIYEFRNDLVLKTLYNTIKKLDLI